MFCLHGFETEASASTEACWELLPMELFDRIAALLPPNEVPCNLRLANKALAGHLTSPHQTTVHLSQPVPPLAFACHWRSPAATHNLSFRQRRLLLALTAASGDLHNLELAAQMAGCWLGASSTSGCGSDLMAAAAAAGRLHVCEWLLHRECPWGKALEAGARAGHRHVCEWLLANGCTWGPRGLLYDGTIAVQAAARGAHLDVLYWLLERCKEQGLCVKEGELLEGAAEGLDLPALQRLYSTWIEGDEDEAEGDGLELSIDAKEAILAAAAGSPTPDWRAKVEWLEGLCFPRTAAGCARAAYCQDAPERLTWLQQRGYVIDHGVIAAAAKAGNVAALQHVFDGPFLDSCYNPPFAPADAPPVFPPGAEISAASSGRLAVLQCLHSQGWRMDPVVVVRTAALQGHLAVVAWLVEAFGLAPTDLEGGIFRAAAESGSVELLRWLHARGCPWGVDVLASAVKGGCEAAMEWVVEKSQQDPGCLAEEYDQAAYRGDLSTLRCARRLGFL